MGSTCSRTEATYWAISTNTPSKPRTATAMSSNPLRCRGFTAHLRCPLRPASTERRLVRTRGPREDPSPKLRPGTHGADGTSRVPSGACSDATTARSCLASSCSSGSRWCWPWSSSRSARPPSSARRPRRRPMRRRSPACRRSSTSSRRSGSGSPRPTSPRSTRAPSWPGCATTPAATRASWSARSSTCSPPTSRCGRAAPKGSVPRPRCEARGRQGHGPGAGARGAVGRARGRGPAGRERHAHLRQPGSPHHPARMGGAGAAARLQAARLPGRRRARALPREPRLLGVAERPSPARGRRRAREPSVEPPSRLQRDGRARRQLRPRGQPRPAGDGGAGPDRRAAALAGLQHDLARRRRARQPHAHRPRVLGAGRRKRGVHRPARGRRPGHPPDRLGEARRGARRHRVLSAPRAISVDRPTRRS